MTSKEKPLNFEPTLHVSGVIVRVGDEVLLLKRAPYKKYGANQWAVVAGKIEEGENPMNAAKRELFEELGLQVSESDLNEVATYYHSPQHDPSHKIVWNTFYYCLKEKPTLILNKEHTEYAWAHKSDYKNFDLIDGEEFCLTDYFVDNK